MSLGSRVRLGFIAFVALLALALTYHAVTIRRAAASARALYTRSRDAAELERTFASTRDYSVGLRRLDSLRIASEEREVAAASRAARQSAAIAWGTTAAALALALVLSRMLLHSIDATARMRREFVSNISHDLKTPLASMQETTALLLDSVAGPLNAKQRQLLTLSQESGNRLQGMIAKLLEMARLESVTTATHAAADVVELTRAAATRVNDIALARGEQPRVHLHATMPELTARVDADGIAHLLDNLIENALRLSPTDTRVEVTILIRDGAIEISVADQGPGVPDDVKQRVFERFYQTSAGRSSRSHGVGLGLAICQHVVTEHGGTLHVRDNIPRGAVFVVMLPSSLLAVRDRVRDEVQLTGLVVDRERHVPLVVSRERHFDRAGE
jgi:signal transduction histidine kinase